METAQPREKSYMLKDGGSLFPNITPHGAKLFRYRYRIGVKPLYQSAFDVLEEGEPSDCSMCASERLTAGCDRGTAWRRHLYRAG